MRCLNVIVADADRDALIRNTGLLSKMEDIDVVASTMYGEEVIEKVCSCDVDVVVTDVVLKGIDGIGVLDAFQKMEKPSPVKLILTRIATDSVQKAVVERGASFFMAKPAAPAQLYERIRMLCGADLRKEQKRYPEDSIGALLRGIGVSAEMKGYVYLCEAVKIRISSANEGGKLTEMVYPVIAERFSTTAESVERAIRTAIASAWKSGAIQRFALENTDWALFHKKPTAGQMIDKLYRTILRSDSSVN